MTVPLLHGWEIIATVLILLAVVAVAAVVVLAAGRNASGRSDWQAWLDGRSASARTRPGEPDTDPGTAIRDAGRDDDARTSRSLSGR
jgi:hypothetical protein